MQDKIDNILVCALDKKNKYTIVFTIFLYV